MLSRKDPIGQGVDFTKLDAMAEMLWNDTGEVTQIDQPRSVSPRLQRTG